jgi:hypothetical protein
VSQADFLQRSIQADTICVHAAVAVLTAHYSISSGTSNASAAHTNNDVFGSGHVLYNGLCVSSVRSGVGHKTTKNHAAQENTRKDR